MKDETFRPNRVLSYFQEEWKILFFVTVSGLIYNLGLLAGPWFEGKMTGKLVDLLGGTGTFHQMLMLVTAYVVSIGIVQVSRYFKRFYVRRFANNVNRHMKQILYGTLVRKSRSGAGSGRYRKCTDEGHSRRRRLRRRHAEIYNGNL